jgi:hypothetical protein
VDVHGQATPLSLRKAGEEIIRSTTRQWSYGWENAVEASSATSVDLRKTSFRFFYSRAGTTAEKFGDR